MTRDLVMTQLRRKIFQSESDKIVFYVNKMGKEIGVYGWFGLQLKHFGVSYRYM